MKRKARINYLLEQHLSGKISRDESAELMTLLDESEQDLIDAIEKAIENAVSSNKQASYVKPEAKRKESILNKILSSDKTGLPAPNRKNSVFLLIRYSRKIAAAIGFLLVITAICLEKRPWRTAIENTSLSNNSTPDIPATYTRSFILPDSSFVVLNAGSTLSWPETFHGDIREVTLKGEAYFDIRHLENPTTPGIRKPFIIHTGKVKTTVLGTAFHIKAYPEEKDIMVSVTKGRVKVEDESRVLAILTEDERITYTIQDSGSRAEQVDGQKGMDWVRADMEFDGVSFGTIARVLEKRYGVRISFSNPLLRDCLIVATFSGTETLANVLDALCTIRNANYQVESPDKFTIDGDGCD